MARYSSTVLDQFGAPVVGALVTVRNEDGTTPVLTDDSGNVLDNPLESDGYGAYYFNVADGRYDLSSYFRSRLVTKEWGIPIIADYADYYKGATGNPGANVSAIGSKIQADAGITIPLATSLAVTSDYNSAGVGGVSYSANTPSAASVLTNYPKAAFRDTGNNRTFAMVKQAPPITAFGAVGDNDTDNYAAVMATYQWAVAAGEPKIIIPRGQFRCNQALAFDNPITIEGMNSGRPGSTGTKSQLYFPNATDGIVLHSDRSTPNTGQPGAFGSIVRGVMIIGEQTSRTTSMIRMRASSTIEKVITNFGGLGINVFASVGGGGDLEGNNNGFAVRDCRIDSARVGGLTTGGSDSNAGLFENLDASNCGLFGFRMLNLLSNTIINLHAASDGTYAGAKDGYFGAVNQPTGSGGYNFYTAALTASSSDLATTTPGTNNNIWIFVHAGANPAYPIYQSGYATYAPAGPYLYGAINSPTPMIGLYAESDQAPAQFTNPAIVIGGSLDSGYVGNALVIRNLFGALLNPYGYSTYDGPTGIGVNVGDGPGGNNILNRTDPTYFASAWNLRQRGAQLVEGFGTGDNGIFETLDGPTLARPGCRYPKYIGTGNLPGTFANDAAASTGGVPVGEMYRGTDGLMHFRIA